MIKAINTISCVGCRLCEYVCPGDIFRLGEDGKMKIVYQGDCCTCLQCRYVCPVDALSFVPTDAVKFRMDDEWKKIKELMGAVDNPQGEITKLPPWELAKLKGGNAGNGGWNGAKADGGWKK